MSKSSCTLVVCQNPNCKKEFLVKPSTLSKGYGKFCSRSCVHRFAAGIDLVLEKIDKEGPLDRSTGTRCWIWTAGKNPKGYGRVHFRGKVRFVHKVVFEHLRGSVPAGFDLHHLCENKDCANPAHLETLLHGEHTALTNSARPLPTHCPHGHLYDGLNKRTGHRTCSTCWKLKHPNTNYPHNAYKTHCPRGHLYGEANKRGFRVCKICESRRQRKI